MSDPVTALAADVSAWIDTLEALDLRRAPLQARYGPGGTFDHERKILLCTIKDEYRMNAETKVTEAALDDRGHSDARYRTFVEQAATERVTLAELDAQRVAIDHRIQHARTMLYLQGRLAGVT